MPIRLRLKEALEQQNITVYRLAEASGVDRNTLYNLVNKDRNRLDLGVLDRVLEALDGLTGKRVKLADVLEREETKYEFGDGEPVPDDIKERIERLESGKSKLKPWREVKAAEQEKRGL